MRNKKIDSVTKVLWIFIAFIFILFLYIYKVNSDINNYSTYNDTLNELKIIDKELDNFLLQKSSFIDYDKINKKVKRFDNNIEFLNSESFYKMFGTQYKYLLLDIIKKYKIKTQAIEYFKSQNSQLVNSMHYLYELNEEISKSKTIDAKQIHIANDTFLSLMRYYVNSTLNTKDIKDNVEYLNSKIKDNLTMEIFSEHVLIDIKRIDGFTKIQNTQELDATAKALDALHIFLKKDYDKNYFIEKTIAFVLFIVALLILFILIIMNKRSIQMRNRVEHMAYHDSLTTLPNRANIEKYLKKRIPIAKRSDSKIAILFIDLDRFKIINDTLGHEVGDELLIETSKRIRYALRTSDILARVGGDEFIIVIEAPSNDYSAAHVCEKILTLFNTPLQTVSHQLNITLSIGVSIFPDDDTDYKKLLKYADIAMYEAKNSGKNTYRYYKKNLSIEAHNRLDMEQALKVALNNSELYMMYQPKYNISDKSIVGLEALVRWQNSDLGNVGPDAFIPVAEDTGYIIDIGLFIFEQACKDFLLFKQSSKTLKSISINISTVQLYQNSFIDDIMSIVKRNDINTQSIMLEITETHIMKSIKYGIKLLGELKELGFNISIDDFGTGHSSLSYLKLFPIDELKIDKSFVDDLPDDKSDVAITKAIIALSQTMGYVNVAEGIEDKVQEQFLLENGCAIGQGFYFCKPKKKDDLIEFLQLS